jgi:hypothetical protein
MGNVANADAWRHSLGDDYPNYRDYATDFKE